ncbi:hypothetical protein J6590_022543 [Homalodisca vitripennis]|nr:hypothetical protein J6590_022543 [Homalodisca vitripennis]
MEAGNNRGAELSLASWWADLQETHHNTARDPPAPPLICPVHTTAPPPPRLMASLNQFRAEDHHILIWLHKPLAAHRMYKSCCK